MADTEISGSKVVAGIVGMVCLGAAVVFATRTAAEQSVLMSKRACASAQPSQACTATPDAPLSIGPGLLL